MNYNDYSKAITAEDLIRRYNLNNLVKDRKTITSLERNLNSTDTLIKNFADAVTKDLKTLQDQVDGNITTWFFEGIPTLENAPANEWLDDVTKNNHLGDLYYDQDTGYAYRFSLNDNVFKWIEIKDTDVVEALALANSAQDTADKKRQVFVTEPIPPYEVGDLWIKEDKDLYRCRAKRTEGDFNEVDWIKATDYSNDDYAKNVEAVLNQFKEDVSATYATSVQLETTRDSILGEVTSTTQKIIETANEKYEYYDTEISSLKVDVGNINVSVAEFKEETEGKFTAFSSELDVQSKEIALKLNATDFTLEAIIGLINNDGTSEAKIKADKISFEGTTIDLTTQKMNVVSEHFTLSENGDVTIKDDGGNNPHLSIISDTEQISFRSNQIHFSDSYGNTMFIRPGSITMFNVNTFPDSLGSFYSSTSATIDGGVEAKRYEVPALKSDYENLSHADSFLEEIARIDIAQYSYEDSFGFPVYQLGLVADNEEDVPSDGYYTPSIVQDGEHKKINVYSLATLALKGVQELYNQTAMESGTLSLNSGYNYRYSADRPMYYKINGVVYLRGLIGRTTTTNRTIATLPSGFRPAGNYNRFALASGYGSDMFIWVQVASNGQITLNNDVTFDAVSLSGICFVAEN